MKINFKLKKINRFTPAGDNYQSTALFKCKHLKIEGVIFLQKQDPIGILKTNFPPPYQLLKNISNVLYEY